MDSFTVNGKTNNIKNRVDSHSERIEILPTDQHQRRQEPRPDSARLLQQAAVVGVTSRNGAVVREVELGNQELSTAYRNIKMFVNNGMEWNAITNYLSQCCPVH